MLLICVSPVMFLAGCKAEMSEEQIREMGGVPFDDEYNFTEIKEISGPEGGFQSLYLVSDNQSRIVYYYSSSTSSKGRAICPYYSENGKLCKFIDNKIIEVN